LIISQELSCYICNPLNYLFCFFVIILLISLCFRQVRNSFLKIKKRTWILLIIIFLLASFFRFSGSHYHFVFYDEHYLNTMARNILLHNTAGQCTYSSFISDQVYCANTIQPFTGWSVIISISYFLFGINESISFYLTSFIGSFTVVLVFLLSYLLFKKESYALTASFLIAICSFHISWSKSTTSTIFALFLVMLVLLFQLLYCKTRISKFNFIMILLYAYLIQTRIEFIMYIPLIFLTYFLFLNFFRTKILHLIYSWLLFSSLIIFYIPQVQRIMINSPTLDSSSRFLILFPSMLMKYLTGVYQPNFLYIFLFIGLIFSLIKYRKQSLFIIFSYVIALLSYTTFSSLSGVIFLRYYLLNIVFIVILQGIGISIILNIITSKIKHYKKAISFLLIFLTLLIIFVPTYTMIKDGFLVTNYQVLTSKIPEFAKSYLNQDCFVIASRYDELMFSSGTLFKTILINNFMPYFRKDPLILNDPFLCVIYYEGKACRGPFSDPVSKRECNLMRDMFKVKPLISYKFVSENHNIYALIPKDKNAKT